MKTIFGCILSIIIPTTLVCVLFDPTIPTYTFICVMFFTSMGSEQQYEHQDLVL